MAHVHAGHGHAHDGHGHAHAPHAHEPRGHGHHQHHTPPPSDGTERAFAIGLALNAGFVAAEAACGFAFDSLALLGDAAHNLGDVAGLALAWAGLAAGRLAPDARHTYGWKRASILAALGNALLLVGLAVVLGVEAARRFGAPPEVPGLPIIVVAAIGIAVNGATAWLFARGREHDLNRRGAYLHMVADAAVSAAVVVGGGLTLAYGWAWIDPLLAFAIALVIAGGTLGLLRDSLHLLGDGVPRHIDLGAVRATLAALPGVAAVDDLHVWAMGTTDVALTAHLVMPDGAADDAFLHDAAARLRAAHGIAHVTLQTMRAPGGAGCRPVAQA